ncbi:hypothetical protein ACWDSJ_26080 [Nocardia sp. NPDC003482]
MSTNSIETASRAGDEWKWLSAPIAPTPLHPNPDPASQTEPDSDEWTWLDRTDGSADAAADGTGSRRRRSPRMWLVIAVVGAIGVLGVIGVLAPGDSGRQAASSTVTAGPPTTTVPAVATACAGLTGNVVTDGRGDTNSPAGVIAVFEAGYYRARSAAEALRVVGPEAGLAPDALAAGIASIPEGTTHCVAITPLSDTAANVHLVELHPDGQRVDYLQVINTRAGESGFVITNIQGQR